MIVSIEGTDGSGKGTTAAALSAALAGKGKTATVISYPQYGKTAASRIITAYLDSTLDIDLDPHTLASYYALDRFETRTMLLDAVAKDGIVILDRYVHSNIAYQGARLHEAELGPFAAWIDHLEFSAFGMPRPDLTVFLNASLELSRTLVARKAARSYTDKTLDKLEANDALQRRVRQIYQTLAGGGGFGRWLTIDIEAGAQLKPPHEIAETIAAHIA